MYLTQFTAVVGCHTVVYDGSSLYVTAGDEGISPASAWAFLQMVEIWEKAPIEQGSEHESENTQEAQLQTAATAVTGRPRKKRKGQEEPTTTTVSDEHLAETAASAEEPDTTVSDERLAETAVSAELKESPNPADVQLDPVDSPASDVAVPEERLPETPTADVGLPDAVLQAFRIKDVVAYFLDCGHTPDTIWGAVSPYAETIPALKRLPNPQERVERVAAAYF